MRPILPGARGPAVEDIQRRLLKMGFDLGPTGVDGVFLGMTREAVEAFQHRLSLLEDGIVGPETWSALVDSTFTLGDRTLYLRLPYLHGRDVLLLQEALSALGFSCGAIDGIFGASTEHAVRGFQRNCGQPADGIAGLDTIAALMNLRHVWEGKQGAPAGSASSDSVYSRDVLRSNVVDMEAEEGMALDVAGRFLNLALASAHDARVGLVKRGEDARAGITFVLVSEEPLDESIPIVDLGSDSATAFASRLATAVAVAGRTPTRIGIDLGSLSTGDEALQRAAVRLLDAVCAALA